MSRRDEIIERILQDNKGTIYHEDYLAEQVWDAAIEEVRKNIDARKYKNWGGAELLYYNDIIDLLDSLTEVKK